MKYDLSHLTQSIKQDVIGPIQDDEALFLYSLIKCMRLKTILEIGSLAGYSAVNFLKSLPEDGKLYTVDLKYVKNISDNHKHIQKNCKDLTNKDIENHIDLIFFDCHMYDEQIATFYNIEKFGIIDDKTILVLHDTNLHPKKFVNWAYPVDDGFCHQPVERKMVNLFKQIGYSAFMLHTAMSSHDQNLPFRHGLTIMQKNNNLNT
jgi:hypothetical protein